MFREFNQVFTVAKTYAIVTPESAERGDYAEHDFVYDDKPMSLAEVLKEVKHLGFYESNEDWNTSITLYGTGVEIDYQNASETTEALHIRGSKRAIARLKKILKG